MDCDQRLLDYFYGKPELTCDDIPAEEEVVWRPEKDYCKKI